MPEQNARGFGACQKQREGISGYEELLLPIKEMRDNKKKKVQLNLEL